MSFYCGVERGELLQAPGLYGRQRILRQTSARCLALQELDHALSKLARVLRDRTCAGELRAKASRSGSCRYQRLAIAERFYCLYRETCPEGNGIDYHRGRSVR